MQPHQRTKRFPTKLATSQVNAGGKKIVENKEVVKRLFLSVWNNCFITLPQTFF